MPSSHLILCRPLLLLPPIPLSIRVFSNESTLCMRWPKYWSFSFSIISSSEHPGLIPLEWTGWISLYSKGLSRVFSNTTAQKHPKNQNSQLPCKVLKHQHFIIFALLTVMPNNFTQGKQVQFPIRIKKKKLRILRINKLLSKWKFLHSVKNYEVV